MKLAFSLVELSIVLVILGLLTGGILAGQSLIRAAELRAVVSDYNRYRSAIFSFRDKYMAYPGDMRNATAFWGAADAGDGLGTDCYAIASQNSSTCNGNGDGVVGKPSDVAWGALYQAAEEFRFWQHLANAGLIEGSYTGVTNSSTNSYQAVPSVNTPASRLNSSLGVRCAPTNTSTYFPAIAGKTVLAMTGDNSLTPAENYSMDIKIDDGKPAYGNVVAPLGSQTWALNCATSDNPATAEYNLPLAEKRCLFIAACQ